LLRSSRNRHPLLAAVPLAVIAAVSLCCASKVERLAPNVLFISIDTLRSDHLGAYGYARPTSPNIDHLARAGALFTTSYSQASSTVPTHASLFTGRYPFQHRTFGYKNALPAEERTLAEYLGEHGYRTLAITSSIRFIEGSGFEQGFQSYKVLLGSKNLRTHKVIDTVLAALSKDSEQPLFAFAHFFDPHAPYTPPGRLDRQWYSGVEEVKPKDTAKFLQSHRQPTRFVAPATLDFLKALYDGEILFLDGELGRLFSWVDGHRSPRTTLVVVTADHGEEFKEHGGLSHAVNLHEELLRVPLIFYWPSKIPSELVVQQPVQSVDVFPTIVDLLRLPLPDGLVGHSYAAVLRGEAAAPEDPRELILAQENPDTWAIYATLASGRFKLESSRQGQPERLYELREDPGGHKNVLRHFPSEARTLEALADSLGVTSAPPLDPLAERAVPPEVVEQLRAIGYADEVEGEQGLSDRTSR